MDRDLLVGIAGAVVLVGAMVGVFTYESQNAASGGTPFDVMWTVRDGNGPSGDGPADMAEGDCGPFSFNIAQPNLTELTITISPGADPDDNDVVSGDADGPGDEIPPKDGTSDDGGGVVIVFSLSNVPTATTVSGSSQEAAQTRLQEDHGTALGTGDWTGNGCLESAPGMELPPPLPPVQPDGVGSFTWSVSYKYFEGTASQA